MVIVVVGLSHRTSPLPVRESMAFVKDRLADALRQMREQAGLAEAMILSTCNRVELYGRGAEGEEASGRLEEFLCAFHGRPREEMGPYLYRLSGAEAVRHAFRVAASLESMVIGEPQILGQVKDAYQAAEEAGTLGSALNALRNRSLAAASRARTRRHRPERRLVSYVRRSWPAVFGELKDRMSARRRKTQLAARHLGGRGLRDGPGRAHLREGRELVASLRAAPFESLRAELAVADIVISGTGAPGS